jgi:hypothetical protein
MAFSVDTQPLREVPAAFRIDIQRAGRQLKFAVECSRGAMRETDLTALATPDQSPV